MNRGRFITLEGGEGAGKSSSLACIGEALRRRGIDVIFTREPGGTVFGERLRELVLAHDDPVCAEAELLTMFAGRVEHVRQVIAPALEAGKWVLSDRFTDASYAYQGGGRGVSPAIIRALEEWSLGGLVPDLTFLLDVSVDVGMARVRSRGASDRFEAEGMDFQNRVRQAYLERARECSDRIVLIDAGLTAETVHRHLVEQLHERFGLELGTP